jgi:hypothetical protein
MPKQRILQADLSADCQRNNQPVPKIRLLSMEANTLLAKQKIAGTFSS